MIEDQKYADLLEELKIDCSNCKGLCCVALYYAKEEGFPQDKVAGKPCTYLKKDCTCSIHQELTDKGLHGCMAYDCFGAGQKVIMSTYEGKSWEGSSKVAKEMFEVFLKMRQLHEMLWYLIQSVSIKAASPLMQAIEALITETRELTELSAKEILQLDIEAHRDRVNVVLRKVSELVREDVASAKKANAKNKKTLQPGHMYFGANLTKTNLIGADFAGALLIAANLKNADLTGANLIGADLRDTNLCGANLAECLFLTQAQINTAKGNAQTKLPRGLVKPSYWEK